MEKTEFNYFYGNEADLYSFYRIPKELFTNEKFKNLSTDAKLIYGLMLDRMSLSLKNGWLDEQKRVYIFFSMEEVMESMNCSKNKALKSLGELDTETGIGLIERVKQGCRLSSKFEHFFRKLTDRIEHSDLSVISIFNV